ncbi:MAG TPA: phage head closure protein [Sunxiuqinia sp.]|nr:phage head closure protein [Sunxiuqinia sp.]
MPGGFGRGSRNKLVRLEKQVKVPNGFGGYTMAWEQVGDPIWCSIWPMTKKQMLTQGTINNEISHEIRMDYRSKIKTSWRITYGDRHFAIAAPPINPNEDDKALTLLVKESL